MSTLEKSVSVSFFCCWRCAQDRTIWFHGWPTKFVWPIKCPSLCFSGRLHTVVKNEHEFAEVVLLMKPHCLQQRRPRQRPGSVPWLFPMCSIGIRAVLNYFVCVFGSRGCQAAANSKLRHFPAFFWSSTSCHIPRSLTRADICTVTQSAGVLWTLDLEMVVFEPQTAGWGPRTPATAVQEWAC